MLGLTDISRDDFENMWATDVSNRYGYPIDEVKGLYDRDTDPHNSEMKTRAIWKYGAAKGVSGDPVAFINGAKLDSIPNSTDDWIDLLNSVYDSQWHSESDDGFIQ